MDHQVGMGVADRGADLQEQPQAVMWRQREFVGVVGDGLALDVIQRQVGLAVAADAGVEQAGDVGMPQPRRDLPLAGDARAQAGNTQAPSSTSSQVTSIRGNSWPL